MNIPEQIPPFKGNEPWYLLFGGLILGFLAISFSVGIINGLFFVAVVMLIAALFTAMGR